MNQQPEWMQTLLNPEFYSSYTGSTPESVELIQTHISWVFIAGDRVFKLKKPVDFGFLDFSTLEKREEFCKAELRLNRRLCPDIYLETATLTKDGETWAINGDGEVVEWILIMKTMPQDGLMNRLLQQDLILKDDIDRIVAKLTPFYQQADSGESVREMGSIKTITHNTEENFEQTQGFKGEIIPEEVFEQISSYTRSFISDNASLFEKRISQGWIREGHGDLYSANICFDRENDDVYIFDCIEFNQRFRCGDVASDVAFLAMDLDHFGLPELSRYFIETFSKESADPDLKKLNNFYKCYRAYVRGKIGCFTWSDPGVPEEVRESSKQQAKDYFKLALKYAGGGERGVLYVFFGLSGTGKSTVAEAWAKRKALPIYNSDRVRKEVVAGISAQESHMEPFGQGIYSREMTERTYRALSRLAGSLLVRGESVVLDATYTSHDERENLTEMAEAAGADIKFILCTCPEETVKKRLEERQAKEQSVSDGRWEIYLRQKEHFAPVDTLPQENVVIIDTSGDLETILNELEKTI